MFFPSWLFRPLNPIMLARVLFSTCTHFQGLAIGHVFWEGAAYPCTPLEWALIVHRPVSYPSTVPLLLAFLDHESSTARPGFSEGQTPSLSWDAKGLLGVKTLKGKGRKWDQAGSQQVELWWRSDRSLSPVGTWSRDSGFERVLCWVLCAKSLYHGFPLSLADGILRRAWPGCKNWGRHEGADLP